MENPSKMDDDFGLPLFWTATDFDFQVLSTCPYMSTFVFIHAPHVVRVYLFPESS